MTNKGGRDEYDWKGVDMDGLGVDMFDCACVVLPIGVDNDRV